MLIYLILSYLFQAVWGLHFCREQIGIVQIGGVKKKPGA